GGRGRGSGSGPARPGVGVGAGAGTGAGVDSGPPSAAGTPGRSTPATGAESWHTSCALATPGAGVRSLPSLAVRGVYPGEGAHPRRHGLPALEGLCRSLLDLLGDFRLDLLQ